MLYTRVVIKSATDRIHRYDIFRTVVFYGGKVAKLSCDCFVRGQKICHLHIDFLIPSGCHEIDFPCPQDADINLESLSQKMEIDNILHYFLYAAPDIESAEIVADAMICKVVFVDQFKQLFAANIISCYRVYDISIEYLVRPRPQCTRGFR